MELQMIQQRETNKEVDKDFRETKSQNSKNSKIHSIGKYTENFMFVDVRRFALFLGPKWLPQGPGGIQMAPDQNSASFGGKNAPWGFFWTRFGHRDNANSALVRTVL